MADNTENTPRPAPCLEGLTHYSVPRPKAPVTLQLDGNEGLLPPRWIWEAVLEFGPEILRRYPSARGLEQLLAGMFELPSEQVIVTAGGDSALDAACRSVLAPGREIIIPRPTFEMIERYAKFTGADIVHIPWSSHAYPTDEVIAAKSEKTAAVVIVSPNNPTGTTATTEDLVRLSEAFPQSLIILDLAYVEFADADPTRFALMLPNVVVIRTLSKAWGLAGLRIGYALGSKEVIGWMRAATNPYPVSGAGLEIASTWLETGQSRVNAFIDTIKVQRVELGRLLAARGLDVYPSQANFIFLRTRRAAWLGEALAGFGIAIRTFPGRPGLEDAVRITLPGTEEQFFRLRHALLSVLEPQAVIFDIDGVLADVSQSYREAIVQTAAAFGVVVSKEDVSRIKAAGDANNDWVVTHRLIAERGVHVGLDEVTARFEALYQGFGGVPGLREKERLLVPAQTLERIAQRLPLGVVTGRPRADAQRFLERAGIDKYFRAIVCLEDAPLKPKPDPILLAMERLNAESAWMIGDTPDDIRACRAAAVLPIGVLAPGEVTEVMGQNLYQAGAARVLANINEIEELLYERAGI